MNSFSDWSEFEQTVLASGYHESRDELMHLSARTASPSQAFALAYQAALLRLIPNLDSHKWAAFCVSEAQGNHPRNLQTRASLDELGHIVLNGEKTFVTHGAHVKQLLVVAKSHDPEESDRLRAYFLKQGTNGVEISESRPAGILPDLDHGKLHLDDAPAVLLPGDGHRDYSKRFRLLEDQFMLAVFCRHIAAQVKRLNLIDENLVHEANELAEQVKLNADLDATEIVSLSSMYNQFMTLSDKFAEALRNHSELHKQWQRDSKLFLLAKKAREIRTFNAKQSLSSGS